MDRSEVAEELDYLSGRLRKLLRRLRHEDWDGKRQLEEVLTVLDSLKEAVA